MSKLYFGDRHIFTRRNSSASAVDGMDICWAKKKKNKNNHN